MDTFVQSEKFMNFAERLGSEDLRDHLSAVVFLRGEGASGEVYLPRLLEICKRIDVRNRNKSEREQSFIVLSARAMGEIIKLVGFQERNELHTGCIKWFDDLLTAGETDSIFAGIWGYGDLGSPPKITIDRLYHIATGERLLNEPLQMSSRGLAFRIIAKLDARLAQTLIECCCCTEYLQGIDSWIAEYREKYPSNSKLIEDLVEESRRLRPN